MALMMMLLIKQLLIYSLKLMWKYKTRLTIKPSESYGLLSYKFFNAAGDEIEL